MAKQTLEYFSQDEIKRGIFLALNNAEDLIKEGDLLFENAMVLRAYSLYQLSLEELGKAGQLYDLLLTIKVGIEINWNKVNDEFSSHKEKTKQAIDFEICSIIPPLLREKGLKKTKVLQSLKELVQQQTDVFNSNKLKNDSLYLGISVDKFISPKDIITKEMTELLKKDLTVRYNIAKKILTDFANGKDDETINEIREIVLKHRLQKNLEIRNK